MIYIKKEGCLLRTEYGMLILIINKGTLKTLFIHLVNYNSRINIMSMKSRFCIATKFFSKKVCLQLELYTEGRQRDRKEFAPCLWFMLYFLHIT